MTYPLLQFAFLNFMELISLYKILNLHLRDRLFFISYKDRLFFISYVVYFLLVM